MPDDTTDEGELGSAPTAVTAVVPEQRNREHTQQIAMPDPEWAAGKLPPTGISLDETAPSMHLPKPPPPSQPAQPARAFFRGVLHEFKKLPYQTRTTLIVIASVLFGLILGLIIAPNGSRAPSPRAADDALVSHAKRLSIAERDAIMRSLSVADTTAALMMLRQMSVKDHLAADPLAQLLRGRLALAARDGVDALDNFEAALATNPKLAEEPWLADAVVQTFAANKVQRTTALLARLPKDAATKALEAGCMDWAFRVRRSAQDALKNQSGACPDPVGALMIDAYQADKCDAARAVVQKLVPLAPTDERVGAALDAISRRPAVASCVAELIPRK